MHDKKGQRKTSEQYATVIEAENDDFKYRYTLESYNYKLKLDELRSSFELILESDKPTTNSFSVYSTVPTHPPKRAKINPHKRNHMDCQVVAISIKSLNHQQIQIIALQP